VAGHSPEARAKQAEKQRQHAAELKAWNPSEKPDWLTEEVYREKVQPRLAGITVPAIASALGISQPYAAEIRAGRAANKSGNSEVDYLDQTVCFDGEHGEQEGGLEALM